MDRRCLPALAVALLAGACSPPVPPPPEPPHLLYSLDVASLDNPFPDARLLTADGMRLDLRKDWYRPFLMKKAITAQVADLLDVYTRTAIELHGANNFGPTLLRPSVPVDRSSLAGHAARLVRREDRFEVLEADVAIEHSRDALGGTGVDVPADYPEFLVVRPSVPLPGGAEGMLVITRGIRAADGEELGRGNDFAADEDSPARIDSAAAALGIPADDVLLALPIRTQDAIGPMQRLADFTTEESFVPAYQIPAHGTVPEGNGYRIAGRWTPADPDWESVNAELVRHAFDNPADDVGAVIAGTFSAHDLREDGVWRADWVADPAASPTAELWFTLTLPKGPRPPGGYKVVIGGHGLNGRNTVRLGGGTQSFCTDVAEVLAQRGLGCLGIDAPSHGTRGSSFDFFAIEDLRKARDNFRQMTFDQLQLARMATRLDLDGDGTPDLSPQLGYFGNSLGAIMGGSFVSVDPRVRYGALNVPGGGLANILTGESIRDQIGLLLVARTGLTFGSAEYYAAFPLLRTVGQLFLESGDPVNLGLAFRDRPDVAVLVQEGIGDQTIPNATTEDLAQALGVSAATSSIGGGAPIRSLTRIDPARYGKNASFNGHNVFWEIAAARTQVLDFLGSGGTTLTVE
ncbi:MAG: hypothetical protein IRZ16_12175 [Myxococcaceae bacterium]|nr:hypothetical protein [Myxococcaceae bacterium]